MIHYVFYIIFLILLAIIADAYHKRLRKISNLNKTMAHPKANYERIEEDMEKAKAELHVFKLKALASVVFLTVVHEIATLGELTEWGKNWWIYDSDLIEFTYPLWAGGITIVCVLIIFWLKGQGGGIPKNKWAEKGPGYF